MTIYHSNRKVTKTPFCFLWYLHVWDVCECGHAHRGQRTTSDSSHLLPLLLETKSSKYLHASGYLGHELPGDSSPVSTTYRFWGTKPGNQACMGSAFILANPST